MNYSKRLSLSFIMDYRSFTVEDLASDQLFIRWVLHNDPEAEEFWNVFLISYPEMEHTIQRARALVLNMRIAESRTDLTNIDQLWKRIDASTSPIAKKKKAHPRRFKYLAIAATVSLIVLCLFIVRLQIYDFSNTDPYLLASNDFVEYVNSTKQPVAIILSDSSIVELDPGSRIKYKPSYTGAATREVVLSGSAFFQISKRPDQPFMVRSKEVVTEVLGTSFRVHAPKNEKAVIVSVKTGKVSVYAAGENTEQLRREGVVLLPNQEVAFTQEDHSFTKKIIEEPIVVQENITSEDFTFDNTPISEVFRRLQDAYGIEIIFDEENMKNCFLTAPLGSESLFEKLQIICQTIGGRFEVIDAKIVVGGPGCP